MVTVVQLRGNQEWINVKDYGAVGDGVNDDTDAIRNAINATLDATPAKPAILYFPRGTYRTKSIFMTANVAWLGDGIDKTIIKRIANPNDETTYNYPAVSVSSYGYELARAFIKPRVANINTGEIVTNFMIKDLTVDASGYDWGETPKDVDDNRPIYQRTNHAVQTLYMKNVRFENFKIIDSMNGHFVLRLSENIFINNLIIDGDSQRQAFNYSNIADQNNWGETQPSSSDPNPPPHAGKRRWNQDGIDIYSSNNIIISNIKIFSQDDNIAMWNTNSQEMYGIKISNADLQNLGNGRNLMIFFAGKSGENDTNQLTHDIYINDVICRSAHMRNVIIAPITPATSAAPNTTKILQDVVIDNIYFPPQPHPSTYFNNIIFELHRGFNNNPSANIVQIIQNLHIRSFHNLAPNHRVMTITTPIVTNDTSTYYVLRKCTFDVNVRSDTSGTDPRIFELGYMKDITLKGIIKRQTSTGRQTIVLTDYVKNLDLTGLVIQNEDSQIIGSVPVIQIQTTNINNLILPDPIQLMKQNIIRTQSGVPLPTMIHFVGTNLQNPPTIQEHVTSPATVINSAKYVQTLYISRTGSITSWEISTDGGSTWSTQTIELPTKLILMPNMGIRITFNPTSIRLFTLLYPT